MGLFDDLVPTTVGPPAAPPITSPDPSERQPRGIRNNNPGNIEDGPFARSNPGYAGTDGRFAKYETPEAGQAALEGLLQSYGRRGFSTPAAIIGRYAPASDGNPVGNYAKYVADGVGSGLSDQLDLNDPAIRRTVAQRIVEFENGKRRPATSMATDFSAQSRAPSQIGLFNDLVPQGQVAAPPASGPPPVLAGGDQPQQPEPVGVNTEGLSNRVAREGMSELAPPPTSALQAGARGAATGMTANFYDELVGLAEAGGRKRDSAEPLGLGNILAGAYKRLMSDPKAAEAYDMAVARERGVTHKAETDQPVASIAGNIVGGMALPLGAAARGATLAERATQGARVGAVMGGVSGVGAGEDTAGRIAGGVAGAGTGAAIGAAAPAVTQGVTKVAQGVGRLASPIVQAVRGVRDPEAEAARRVTGALRRDVENGSAGLSPAEFAAERAAGSPVALADMGGAATRSLARSAADTSAEGRAALEAVTSERYITQNPRIAQFVKETFDFPDVGAKLEQVQAAARRANAPAYNKAYKEGSGGIWDDGLEQFSQAPVIQDAIRAAFLTARNRSAVEGFPPIKNPFEINKTTGIYELKPSADGSQALPNLQFWDHVKRNLDKVNSPESRAAAKALRDHLDDIVPSYKAAREGAAGWFGAEDALDAGAKFATMGGLDAVKLAQARGHVAKMSDADRKLFETGFVSNLLAKIDSRQDGQDVVKAVFNSPFARKQAEIALGPEKAGMLEAKLQTERVMNALKNEVSGGSPTARRLYELGMAGATNPYTLAGATAGASSYATGGVGPGDAFAAGLVFAARKGQIRIDERVARLVGEMLASNDAATVTKGLKIVARNENMKQALRAFDMPAIRAASQQGTAVPALQAAGISRADEQQQ